MIRTIMAGGITGIDAYMVQVEVDISTGLPGFHMVGFLGGEVKEAKERVQVALRNAGFNLPPMKITVNLAPADIRKEGTAYDLPIALGMLSALGHFADRHTEGRLFLGELGLDGEIKGVRGILPIVREAKRIGIRSCIVPEENALEAAMVAGMEVRGAGRLQSLIDFLRADGTEADRLLPVTEVDRALYMEQEDDKILDFAQIRGQDGAKRAAEIAAAGFHNLLMAGPPGTGKSMIARGIAGILPPLTMEESMEVSAIYSVAGLLEKSRPLITRRPFQAPHHTVSQAALTGGSAVPRPGAVSLAHRGVLFLDELPEFQRALIDSLRQPLEERKLHLARVYGSVTYPADFMLVCAMNPCPCGYYPDKNRCRCTESEIRRYLGKVSGPILDRIDLCAEVFPLGIKGIKAPAGDSSAQIRRRILDARRMQMERFGGETYQFNGQIPAADMEKFCRLDKKQSKLMEQAFETMGLSARGYHRTLRVARTVADLEGEEQIGEEHLMEALAFRMSDRIFGGRRKENGGTGL